jgi:transposase
MKGDARPKPQGGDRRSNRTEAHSAAILKLYQDKPDITLAEIRAGLSENGVHVGHASLWRFFVRHDITLKKSRRMPVNRVSGAAAPRRGSRLRSAADQAASEIAFGA